MTLPTILDLAKLATVVFVLPVWLGVWYCTGILAGTTTLARLVRRATRKGGGDRIDR